MQVLSTINKLHNCLQKLFKVQVSIIGIGKEFQSRMVFERLNYIWLQLQYLVVLYLKMFSCGFEGTLIACGRLDFVGKNLLTLHSCTCYSYSCGLPIGICLH